MDDQTAFIYLILGLGIFGVFMLTLGTTGPTGVSEGTRDTILGAIPYLFGLGIVALAIPKMGGRR